ncbi:MAG: protein kinase domain-containing protein [Kangiellaceae bacterium]
MAKDRVTNNQLTWVKTGWFYLWLVVFAVIWYANKSELLEFAETTNLYMIEESGIFSQNQFSPVKLTPTSNSVISIYNQKPALDNKTGLHLRDNQFLLKVSGVLFTELAFSLLTVGLFLLIAGKALWIKISAITSYLLTTILAQLLFLNLDIWFSLTLVYLAFLLSAINLFFYQIELRLFQHQNHKINHLLEKSAIELYQQLSFQSVLPIVEQSVNPTEKLINNIQEIAILAEQEKNNQLAKRLHVWILAHQPKNEVSQERWLAFEESERQSDQENHLENTLVIGDSKGQNAQENTSASAELLNIKNFGRYQTEGILGKGAMGIVFHGVDPKINRHVAIKTLFLHDSLMQTGLTSGSLSEQTAHKAAVERFFKEAETAGNLSHANIVTIYDVGEQDVDSSTGTQTLGYIAMDLLDGATLSDFVAKKNLLPPYLVFQLMIQMADALEYAHQNNIVHRDIKPANIIYNQEHKKATLTDFGIAYIADHSKTKTGTIMGSPYYMSPEQVIGSKVDGRSDIFSLGVTFYQLLTGELPFQGESIASVAFHITNTKHQSVRNHLSKLPSSAARITNKALQKDAGKRYQSMKEFKQALINALKKDYKKQPI